MLTYACMCAQFNTEGWQLVGNVTLHTKKNKKPPASSARLHLFVFPAVQNRSTLVTYTSVDSGVPFGDTNYDHLADFSALCFLQFSGSSTEH